MSSRLAWADAAKGVSIVLVALWHTTDKHLQAVAAQVGPSISTDMWATASLYITPARMPLFFLISGMFAAGAIRRSWRQVYLRPVNHYYIFLVWLALSVPLALLVGSVAANPIDTLRDWVEGMLFGATGPWYIYALVVFFVGAKLCSRLPRWVPLGFALGAALVSFSGVFGGPGNFHYVMENAAFFLTGAYFPNAVRWIAARSSWAISLTAFAIGITLGWLVTLEGLPGFPLIRILAAAVGSTALLSVIVCISERNSTATKFFVWVGQRTLGTYLLHFSVLALLTKAVVALPVHLEGSAAEIVGAIYTPIILFLVISGSILITGALNKLGLGFLFQVPGYDTMRARAKSVSPKRTPTGRHVRI